MKNKNIVYSIIVIVVIIGLIYFFFPKGCVTDADCQKGYVCNLVGKCQKSTTSDWDKYTGLRPDGRCSTDNNNPVSTVDPDCSMFCPLGTPLARTGFAGFCCTNLEETRVIDCDTQEPLYNTKINNYGETINILPTDLIPMEAMLTFYSQGSPSPPAEFRQSVINTVTWNSPASYPSPITSTAVWLESVSIDGVGTKTEFVNKWLSAVRADGQAVWSPSTQTPLSNKIIVSGTPNKKTAIGTSTNGKWQTASFNLDTLSLGTYTIIYKYCFQDEQNRMISPQCSEMPYTMTLTNATISFTVGVILGD